MPACIHVICLKSGPDGQAFNVPASGTAIPVGSIIMGMPSVIIRDQQGSVILVSGIILQVFPDLIGQEIGTPDAI
jgi:hypothetical protein